MSTHKEPNHIVELKNFIGGKWVKATGQAFEVDSPYFGTSIGKGNFSTKQDIESCIRFAKQAQIGWGNTPIKERCQILFKVRENLIANSEIISKTVSLESGKTFNEAFAGLMKGIEVLEYAIGLQNLDSGSKMEVSRGVSCEFRRKPIGVVASITPFNFPAMVPLWTMPIAIAMGNAYIWKPSEKTPLTAEFIVDAFTKAGLPDGILNVLLGDKQSVSDIIAHEDLSAVAFVGSSKVAEIVYKQASSLGKRALCLGGAKNHIVLLPDADPEISGKGIADSFTGCAGQRCMAASVLLAVGDVDSQIAKVVETASKTLPGKSMGALISREQKEFLSLAIDRAIKNGAKLLLDGRNSIVDDEYKSGYWMGPCILDHVSPNSEAACDELFGPILSIVRCKSISEAMEIENSNPYGNACSVFTSNGALAEKILQSASAGMLGVNIGVPVPREPFSFGGIHKSKFGYGDITGEASLNFWSDLIKVTTKWEKQSDHNWMS